VQLTLKPPTVSSWFKSGLPKIEMYPLNEQTDMYLPEYINENICALADRMIIPEHVVLAVLGGEKHDDDD